MRLRIFLPALPFGFVLCRAYALPEPYPEAEAHPEAFAEAQNLVNNAPFSGAIYIVDPNGQPAQGSCPATASQSCGDQGHPSWCCPGACSCIQQQNQNGYIGCCPIGQTCGGPVSVETVTVTAQAQPTALVVSPQQYTTTYSNPNPYTAPPAAVFCQTLTMHGPGLPVVTQGSCGTILIVEGGSKSLKPVVFGIAGVLFLAQLAIARTFHRI